MRFAFWITKATDTHSEYAILIASSQPQWLGEPASILRYAYIACAVIFTLLDTTCEDERCCTEWPFPSISSLPHLQRIY
jgi:hypothetical protein